MAASTESIRCVKTILDWVVEFVYQPLLRTGQRQEAMLRSLEVLQKRMGLQIGDLASDKSVVLVHEVQNQNSYLVLRRAKNGEQMACSRSFDDGL